MATRRFATRAAASLLPVLVAICHASAAFAQADADADAKFAQAWEIQSKLTDEIRAAIQNYEDGLRLGPRSPHAGLAHYNLGILYEKLDDPASARTHYAAASTLAASAADRLDAERRFAALSEAPAAAPPPPDFRRVAAAAVGSWCRPYAAPKYEARKTQKLDFAFNDAGMLQQVAISYLGKDGTMTETASYIASNLAMVDGRYVFQIPIFPNPGYLRVGPDGNIVVRFDNQTPDHPELSFEKCH